MTYPSHPSPDELDRFLERLEEQSPADTLTGQRCLLGTDYDRLVALARSASEAKARLEAAERELAEAKERMDVVLRAGPSTALAVYVHDRAKRAEQKLERLESALELAMSALVTIDDTRGPPVTQRQSAAVDELRRIIGVCRGALGKPGESCCETAPFHAENCQDRKPTK